MKKKIAAVNAKPLKAPRVYLVIDQHNAPGRVIAVFNSYEDADAFCDDECGIEERTLWYGQPDSKGFNL